MRSTEDILLSIAPYGTKCHLELADPWGGLVIDQSMDVTVRGPMAHARELLGLFLARPSATGEGFEFQVTWTGTPDEFKVFVALLKDVGGLEHFDRIKERK